MRTIIAAGLGVALAASAAAQLPLSPTSSNVRFQTVAAGDDVKTNSPGVFIMSTRGDFENYWSYHHGGPAPMVNTDWFTWRLVAIHLGNRPSSGYQVAVARMMRRIDTAVVTLIETTPGPRAMVAQRVTSPWVLLKVERGAFGFQLQTTKVQNNNAIAGGQTVRVGGATVTIIGGGCDHCDHRGNRGCSCGAGRSGCTCKGR